MGHSVRVFRAQLTPRIMLANLGILPLFAALASALVGWQVKGLLGALAGFAIAAALGAEWLVTMYRTTARMNCRVTTEDEGLTLRYIGVNKRIAWNDIVAVRLARSIFWRNLLHIKSRDTRIIVNLNIQPERRELIAVLAQHIDGSKLENFAWQDLKRGT
jgi:hypothetical protein